MTDLQPHIRHDAAGFISTLYNSMPDVMSADSDVRDRGLVEKARVVLGPIFVRHGMETICGINLLHVHWQVESGEIPNQTRRHYDDGIELVTRPTSEPTALAAPSSWLLHRESGRWHVIPFEFSVDDEVRRGAEILRGKPDFLTEVGAAMIEHDLQSHFGICITRRQSLSDDDRATPVEVSAIKGRISVVRPMRLDDEQMKTFIQTSWTFEADGDHGDHGGTPKPVPSPKCNIHGVCESDDPPIGPPYHRKTHVHDPD